MVQAIPKRKRTSDLEDFFWSSALSYTKPGNEKLLTFMVSCKA